MYLDRQVSANSVAPDQNMASYQGLHHLLLTQHIFKHTKCCQTDDEILGEEW